MGCLGGVYEVSGGFRGCFGCSFVPDTAQDDLKRERVQAPASERNSAFSARRSVSAPAVRESRSTMMRVRSLSKDAMRLIAAREQGLTRVPWLFARTSSVPAVIVYKGAYTQFS
jgi:hypothetical protein